MRFALALCIALLASSPGWAERAPVRVGDHRTFGRVVIMLDSTAPATVHQRGTQVDVAVPAENDVVAPDKVPRNVVSIVGVREGARLTVLSGAHIKSRQEGRMLVIDILDPASRGREAAATAGSRSNPGKPTAAPNLQQAAVQPASALPIPAHSVATAAPQPTASEPPPVETPTPPVAEAPPSPPHPVVRTFSVKAGPETGVAAFRQNGVGVVVFDDDVTLADAGDGETTVTPTAAAIQHGTIMTVPLADDEALTTTRSDDGLTVTVGAATGSPAPTSAVPTGVQFQVAKPGRVMAVSDPVSGQIMLIGTTRQVDGRHAIVEVGRSAPGYVLLPTWLGLALETSSDEIDLKVSLSGYTLAIADKAATNATASARVENQFSLPMAPPAVLVRQLNSQIASAAAAPARGRGPDRVAAARTMLALGMSAEAEALLTLAATDDPNIARDPSTLALTGIAAVLAGRPSEATGLDDPALPTGGDIALWRGLRAVAEGKPAPVLAGAWPLLSAYPDAIRQQVAPDVMEAAAENGADVPTADMEGVALALSRALKLVHDGQTDAAIAALTAVKDSRDERDSVRAATALAELRLKAGRISAADAAEQLERQTIRWRGDAQELSLRIRVAELRSQAGQWRAALEQLRDAQAVSPEGKDKLAAARSGVFRSLLAADSSKVAPLDMVLLAGEFADGLPDGDDGDRLAGLVADKLAALDLPTRAIPVLKTLIDKAQSPTARGEYGLRLAQMELDAGDAPAADALLSTIDLNGMAAARDEQRTMLLSRVKAAEGDFTGAATSLLTLSTPQADDMRAKFYAKAGDWQRSLETLDGMLAARVPETGDLNEQEQDLVLRDATAAVQAGNGDALRKVARFERRMTPPRGDLFRILTATAVKSPEDLPRAARELAMSKFLPDRLNALKIR